MWTSSGLHVPQTPAQSALALVGWLCGLAMLPCPQQTYMYSVTININKLLYMKCILNFVLGSADMDA